MGVESLLNGLRNSGRGGLLTPEAPVRLAGRAVLGNVCGMLLARGRARIAEIRQNVRWDALHERCRRGDQAIWSILNKDVLLLVECVIR